MKRKYLAMAFFIAAVPFASAQTQSEHETPLCEAARTNLVVELVYDADASKGCLPRALSEQNWLRRAGHALSLGG